MLEKRVKMSYETFNKKNNFVKTKKRSTNKKREF